MAQTILVVDDEEKIVSMLKGYLEASGFTALAAYEGKAALALARSGKPDCILLDINLPGMDGLSLLRELRKSSDAPVIFLTALAEETDRVVGLELGADDYVTKPFSPRELVARVKALLRRAAPRPRDPDALLRSGELAIDTSKRQVTLAGKDIPLTAAQFDILALMAGAPGKVWTRLEILEASFESSHEGYERTIDAHVKNIRKALGDDSDAPRFIETVRGAGYRFKES